MNKKKVLTYQEIDEFDNLVNKWFEYRQTLKLTKFNKNENSVGIHQKLRHVR